MPVLSDLWFVFQALAIMEVVHGKDHTYVKELKREIRGE